MAEHWWEEVLQLKEEELKQALPDFCRVETSGGGVKLRQQRAWGRIPPELWNIVPVLVCM